MWIAKLKLRHKDCPIVTRCQKYKIIVLSYPSSWYERKGKKYATTTCYFQSSSEIQKKKYYQDLKKDRRITNCEISGDTFTYEIALDEYGEHVMLYYTRQLFFVKPTINHYDGHEYWEVASWKKKVLQAFFQALKGHMDVCIILKLARTPLTDIYFPNVMPKLSKNQKRCISLAYELEYYSYPRKITLEKLAKAAKISLSTYQEHLRKAELKLLPVILEHQLVS